MADFTSSSVDSNRDPINSSNNSSTDKTRPEAPPKGSKEFKRVMERKDDKDEPMATDEEGELLVGDQKATKSIFDIPLKKSKKMSTPSTLKEDPVEDLAPPGTLSAKNNKIDKKSDESLISEEDSSTEKPVAYRSPSPYDLDKDNISAFNYQAIASAENQGKVSPVEIIPETDLKVIVDQIMSYQLKNEGKTETIVTLSEPPIFKGANIVVTTFDTAAKQLNLAFEGLTPEAKRMLDIQQNQTSLRLALEHVGYAVHIVTVTTNVEHPAVSVAAETGNNAKDSRRESNDDSNPKERRNK